MGFTDAFAEGGRAGIGGWWSEVPNPGPSDIFYFHVPLTHADIPVAWN